MPVLGIITGLRAESRLIVGATTGYGEAPETDDGKAVKAGEAAEAGGRTDTIRVECAGADGDHARRLAERLVSEGVDALMSFGIAGGLDPTLAPGDLIVPAALRRADGSAVRCDTAWRKRVMKQIAEFNPKTTDIVGSAQLITHPAPKLALRNLTGAGAVDMESLAVAEIAEDSGLPFIAVRAIADPSDRAPPPAALVVIGDNGAIRPGKAVIAMLRDPSLITRFAVLARDNRAAMQSLGRVARSHGPLFGLI